MLSVGEWLEMWQGSHSVIISSRTRAIKTKLLEMVGQVEKVLKVAII
jgi:hypothetical protein